jgi:hypothetical protein
LPLRLNAQMFTYFLEGCLDIPYKIPLII